MIISHKHKFIFIKTNKTAGTSIEIALSRFCGPQDVITPLSPEDEQLRSSLEIPGAQNYKVKVKANWLQRFWGKPTPPKRIILKNHHGAEIIQQVVPSRTWRSYYKFAVVRNPFDRVISHYHWINGPEKHGSITQYLQKNRHHQLRQRGHRLYAPDGKIKVDHVIRYENLDEELARLADTLKLGEPIVLPKTKSTTRTDRRPYREVLTAEDRAIIERDFAFDIKTFGYAFSNAGGFLLLADWINGILAGPAAIVLENMAL